MGITQPARTIPMRFGCAIKFRDRWQGRLVAAEIDDDWEVLNLIIERGIWRWTTRVKLAFTASPSWSYDALVIDGTSRAVFAREIPPVAARARMLSRDQTPLSDPSARLLGLLVEPGSRRATDVMIRRGGEKYRFPVDLISFDAKTLRLGSRGEELLPYLTDDELVAIVQELLGSNPRISGDERGSLTVRASSGFVTISGNVRTKQMKDLVRASLAALAKMAEISLDVVDDIDLEFVIGRALERAGLQHRAEVYARSTLGEVTMFGRAPSNATVEETTRVVSQVPGVRSVASLIVVGTKSTTSVAS
jgi:osmotically-inducible protein OsmY